MRLHLDHIADDALVALYGESIQLREKAFDEDAPKWVLYARMIRHDEIMHALAERGLLREAARRARASTRANSTSAAKSR